MKTFRRLAFAIAITGAAAALSGCTPSAELAANPYPPPPPLVAESIPQPPVSATSLIWQPGHWEWNGASYAWTSGQWVSPVGHGSNWVVGSWQRVGTVWTWIPGHWI